MFGVPNHLFLIEVINKHSHISTRNHMGTFSYCHFLGRSTSQRNDDLWLGSTARQAQWAANMSGFYTTWSSADVLRAEDQLGPFCSEGGWVMTRTATLFSRLRAQGQDTVCQQHSVGQNRVLAQETVLYSQHQEKMHPNAFFRTSTLHFPCCRKAILSYISAHLSYLWSCEAQNDPTLLTRC